MVDLATAIQFATRDRGVSGFWNHNHLPDGLASHPRWVEGKADIGEDASIEDEAGIGGKFETSEGF